MRQKLRASIEKRAGLYSPETNALRLIHSEADGFPGVYLDDFAGNWLVHSAKPLSPGTWGALQDVAEKAGALSLYFKPLSLKEKGSPIYRWGQPPNAPFEVRENGLKFWVDFDAGYSQGLFLDQRLNRKELRRIAKGQSVLNTFSYTCSFSLAAAAGGAETVSLDLSKPYLNWGQRNFALNNLDSRRPRHDFIFGDVFDWMKRLAKRDKRFDIIILDPPTFSRTKRGKVFRVTRDYPDLVRLACELLTPEAGRILACTNQGSLSQSHFEEMLEEGLALAGRKGTLCAKQMPPDFAGDTYLKNVWINIQAIGVNR